MIAVTAITGSVFGQDIQVNRQNKTIAVTADESITADAEVAVLEIGYHNFGITQDAAFQENVRVAERITKALLDAKVPKANIETEKLHLARTEIDEKWTADMKPKQEAPPWQRLGLSPIKWQKGLGTKLGELVYASNRAPVPKMWRGMTVNTMSALVGSAAEKRPTLTLFPQKVKSDATVYAVFSIE